MPNIFKKPEQRKKWNAYNNRYSKENYKTITIKLNKKTDTDVIEYLEGSEETPTTIFKKLVREKSK